MALKRDFEIKNSGLSANYVVVDTLNLTRDIENNKYNWFLHLNQKHLRQPPTWHTEDALRYYKDLSR